MFDDENPSSRRRVRLLRIIWAARASLVVSIALASVAARAHGPDDPGEGTPPLAWALPRGAQLVAREVDGERLDLYLDDRGITWTESLLESLVRAALDDGYEAGLGVRGVIPWVARDGRWVPAAALLPPVAPVPRKPYEQGIGSSDDIGLVRKSIAPSVGARRRGGLSGKVVYVSAGHGFTWDPSIARWTTQRGNTHDIVEDLVSAETVDQLLTAYLENAGATVFTMRERDMSPAMVIVDAEVGGATVGQGAYSETGAWQDSTSGGFRGDLAPYDEGENPFDGGASRVHLVAAQADAVATWRFTVPAPGLYRVYAAWVAGDNRAPDAHYAVVHVGGTSHVRVDQRRHGGTWMSLGRWYFAGEGRVELHNDSPSAGSYVSADAVRVGGGMGDAARGDGGAAPRGTFSGRPRWEENARYHIQFTGAPQSVYRYASDERSDDVGARSRYAAWQNEAGEDAVYVAWHTNAPSPAVGTSTYVYGPNPPDGTYDFTGTPGSDDLGRLLHDEVVNDLKAAVDPAWRDRGVYSAYFGELNKSHNPEMPSALCEVAFHSTEADAAHLKEPHVRNVAARAFYQAITRYFAERDGLATHLLPEPPPAVRAEGLGPTRVRVSWSPSPTDGAGLVGDAATGYRLYRSADGLGWDDGVDVTGVAREVDVAAGVPSFFRVTGFNDGGESFPSTVVAAMPACEDGARALVVHGFERLDVGLAPREDLAAYDLDSVIRVRLAEMNRFDGVVPHAWALAHAGLAFDSAEASAVRSGDVVLAPYALVDWVLGEESTADETFSDVEQELVAAWLGPERTFITSGAELGWDLGNRGSDADRAFLARLGVTYVSDDAGSYALAWSGGALGLDDGALGMQGAQGALGAFDVQYPDVLAPAGDGEVILTYGGGEVAGVRARGADGTRVVLGAPLESLYPDAARDSFVAALVADAGSARGVACVAEPGPDAEETGPEVLEPVEHVESEVAETSPQEVVEPSDPGDTAAPVEADGSDGKDTFGDGITVGRPAREVTSDVRGGDGGCASTGAASSVSVLVIALYTMFLARRHRPARWLVRRSGP